MDDRTGDESSHLAASAGMLIGHGLNPQPTGLKVTGETGKTAIILCVPRRDDGDKMWFCIPGPESGWLGEADQPVIALTALKSYLSGEETPERLLGEDGAAVAVTPGSVGARR